MRGFTIDHAVACVDGVFEVQFDIFFAADRNSDAALRVRSVGFAQGFLGDDQDAATVSGKADSGAESGNPRANDYVICFLLRSHPISGYRKLAWNAGVRRCPIADARPPCFTLDA